MINKKFILNEALFEEADKLILDENNYILIEADSEEINSDNKDSALKYLQDETYTKDGKAIQDSLSKLTDLIEQNNVEQANFTTPEIDKLTKDKATDLTAIYSSIESLNTLVTEAQKFFKANPILANKTGAINKLNALQRLVQALLTVEPALITKNAGKKKYRGAFKNIGTVLNNAYIAAEPIKKIIDEYNDTVKTINKIITDSFNDGQNNYLKDFKNTIDKLCIGKDNYLAKLKSLFKLNSNSPEQVVDVIAKIENSIINPENSDQVVDADKINGCLQELKLLTSTIQNFKNLLTNSVTTIQNAIKVNDVEAIKTTADQIIKSYNSLQNAAQGTDKYIGAIQNIKDLIPDDIEKADADAKKAKNLDDDIGDLNADPNKIDWQKMLDEAGTDTKKVQSIWAKYYKEIWDTDADKVKELDGSFTQELRKLGFTEATNPFITYVKTLFKNNISVNYTAYTAIHNAAVNGLISAKDVLGGDSKTSKLGFKNLLFNQAFLKLDTDNITEYLKCQRRLINELANKTVNGLTKDGAIILILNILYNKNGQQLGKDININQIEPNLGLNSLTSIRENTAKIFNKYSITAEKTKVDGASANSINKYLINLKNDAAIKKALIYLIGQFPKADKQKIAEIKTTAGITDNEPSLSISNIQTLKQIFDDSSYSITNTNVITIMQELANHLTTAQNNEQKQGTE